MLEKSTTLYFGPWYRRSLFESTRAAGLHRLRHLQPYVSACVLRRPDVEYWALVTGVTVWDVGVERTVELSGNDADRLIDYITCRDLTRCAVGQGKYSCLVAGAGAGHRVHVGPDRPLGTRHPGRRRDGGRGEAHRRCSRPAVRRPGEEAPDRASASEQFEDLLDHQIGLIPDHHVDPSSVGDHRSGLDDSLS